MTENAGFSRPVLLKRVKFCASCQSVNRALLRQSCREPHGGVGFPALNRARPRLITGLWWASGHPAGSGRATEAGRGQSIDPARVVGEIAEDNGRRSDQSK